MNIGKAVAICDNLDSEEHSIEDKLHAIHEVMNSSISSEIEFVPKDASIEHFPADVYFENGRMTFIF